MTQLHSLSRTHILIACAAASLAQSCQVDLAPSPCERTEPYVTAANLYAAGSSVPCGPSDAACLLVSTEAVPHGVAASSGRLVYTVQPGLVAWVLADGPAGQQPEQLNGAAAGPNAAAAQGDLVAWVSGSDSELWLRSMQEGVNRNSQANLVDDCIAFDADRIYVTRNKAGLIGSVLAMASAIANECCCAPGDTSCCASQSACSDGVTLLIDGRINPHGTTALGGSAYWVETGMLRRIGADGSGEEALVAVSDTAGCMAAGSELVFYGDTNAGTIWAYSLVGGCRVPIVSGIHTVTDIPLSVALDEGHLYWTSLEGIWRMPRPF